MFFLEPLTQCLSVQDVLNYQTVNNASVSSNGIDMSKFTRVMYQIQVPSLGLAGTVDARLQASSTSTFAAVTNITNTNLTQITVSSTVNNNAVATIEVRGDQLAELGNNLRYVRLNLTGGGNALTVAAVGWGACAEQGPAQFYDTQTGSTSNATLVNQRVLCNI